MLACVSVALGGGGNTVMIGSELVDETVWMSGSWVRSTSGGSATSWAGKAYAARVGVSDELLAILGSPKEGGVYPVVIALRLITCYQVWIGLTRKLNLETRAGPDSTVA